MTTEELIAAAQRAIGGLDRIRAVRSFHAVARRTYRPGGRKATVTVWRAAGGRVRVEEASRGAVSVRSTAAGEREREELLRDARISPRNMLAHAAERRLVLRGYPAPDGAHVLSAPDDFVLYFFDAKRLLCTLVIDLARERRVELSDYRAVSGIATPFFERHTREGTDESYEDRYVEVSYDAEPPEELG